MTRLIKSAFIAVAATVVLTACGTSSATPDGGSTEDVTVTNTDPKYGVVYVHTVDSNGYVMSTFKFCDGTTLVYNFIGYRKGGGSTISESAECTS